MRSEAAVAGDADGALVLFGGARECSELGDTWRHDGDGWQQVPGAGGPDARRSAGFAYDRARDQLVLFGGGSAFAGDPGANDANAVAAGCTRCRCAEAGTFLLDGDAWSAADVGTEPAPRWNGAMAYVDGRESVLLAGGVAPSDCGEGSAKCGDTWEWNGQDWHQLSPADPEGDGNPNPRDEHALIEDRARGELVMVGGTANTRDFTWLWHPGAEAHPEQLAHFAFGSTGTPRDVAIRRVVLDWEASGESSEGDEVRMRVWHYGQLVPVEDLGFTRDGDRWSADNPDVLSGLPYGTHREIAFAIAPAGANGTHPGYAGLETRFTELLVSYRLPAEP